MLDAEVYKNDDVVVIWPGSIVGSNRNGPETVIDPVNVVLPNNVLFPIWVVEPDINNEPVIDWLPKNLIEPVVA